MDLGSRQAGLFTFLIATTPFLGVAGALVCFSGLVFLVVLHRRRPEAHTVAFFHPFTNDGGGGERVLWCAVRAVQREAENARVVIYSGDNLTAAALEARAADRFGVKLSRPIEVVYLRWRRAVEAETFPRLTLIGQSFGSMVLGFEALVRLTPALFVDTSGYAFTYPIARLAGCRVACYTHYPTVSTDMLERVRNGRAMYNNAGAIANSKLLSEVKVWYYRAVAFLYGQAGSCANVVMVNSSWTEAHVRQLWRGASRRISRVYPPCDTSALQALPLERSLRPEDPPYIISVAQFRPEKAHDLQLAAFARAQSTSGQAHSLLARARLKIVGSCRNAADAKRVQKLRALASALKVADNVDFYVNISYQELIALLGGAVGGLHTMTDEHFGISVVEYMAAGVIPIAHNSAGPKQDIVRPGTGFLAITAEEFCRAIVQVVTMAEAERFRMAQLARDQAKQFSEANFDASFEAAMGQLLRGL